MLDITAILVLFASFFWEVKDDEFGENPRQKRVDLFFRLWIMALSAIFADYLSGRGVIESFAVAWGIHFMFFDYTIAYVLGRQRWYDYLGSNPTDNFLTKIDYRVRLGLRVLFLGGTLTYYFI